MNAQLVQIQMDHATSTTWVDMLQDTRKLLMFGACSLVICTVFLNVVSVIGQLASGIVLLLTIYLGMLCLMNWYSLIHQILMETLTSAATVEEVALSLTGNPLPDQVYRMEIACFKAESTKMLQIMSSTDLISGHMFVTNDQLITKYNYYLRCQYTQILHSVDLSLIRQISVQVASSLKPLLLLLLP